MKLAKDSTIMNDFSMWDAVRMGMQWLFLPIIGSFAYFLKKYVTRIEDLENNVVSLEVKTAVLESKIDDIKEDLQEIKVGVCKLVGRKK